MEDFDMDFEIATDDLGMEKMNISRFNSAYTVRRASQSPIKTTEYSTLQLPTGSVLHTLNGFDTLIPPADGMPDPAIPLVLNERFPIYLRILAQLSHEDSLPFGIRENYVYRPNTLTPAIGHFFQHHRKYHRILSDRTLGTMQGVLTWVDYSPLNEVRVSGTLHAYRKFDVIFRTILNKIVSIGKAKHHYILLPQSNHVFASALLKRTFRELSTGTLNGFSHDPSIFPAIHLLGFVYGKTKDLSVTPYKEDIKILGKTAEVFDHVKSTSLLERIPEDLWESINFIFYKDDRAVIYNLADLAKFAEDSSFYTKFYRHIMNLRLTQSIIPAHVDVDSDQFDTLVENVSGATVTNEETPQVVKEPGQSHLPGEAEAIAPKVEIGISDDDTGSIKPNVVGDTTRIVKDTEDQTPQSFEEKIRQTASTAPAVTLEPKVQDKHNKLIENHFKVTLGGKPIGELMQSPPPEAIAPKKMEHVKSAPEESYKSSSLLSMDRAYHQHAFHHELAKVIGSTAKHGLYATKIEETSTHSEMNRVTTYKVHFQDLSGKAHHVKFTLPHVDDNGLMRLGGTEYRMTRQIANIPICKISPNRVNLSSYYNKIIVERIQSKRNSFEQDMVKLITRLKAMELVKAVIGSAPLPTQNIPFDYSAIGRNFTEISFDGYEFVFDGNGAPANNLNFDKQDKIQGLIQKYGTFVGESQANNNLLFWDKVNQIHEVELNGKLIASWVSFNAMLIDRLGPEAAPDKTVSEWTQANILNQTIPLVFILSYRLGLKTVLDMIRLNYRFYPTGTKPSVKAMDISVRFADGYLVFNRYPLTKSLIASGLSWVDLKDVNFRDLALPETYAKVFQKKDMSVGVLKGLTGFFDFFVDPITETVLEKMNEPTTFPELLLRASAMLSDYTAIESSSVKLHRFRMYERFNGIVYNEIYRGLANHRNNPTTKKAFSINPEAVFQKIVQDATIAPNDVINPIHEIKQRANFTFTGSGGRTPTSFVMKDRIYPVDGIGVISENVPDSGKVGITSYLSTSPNIDDIHGIPKPHEPGEDLEAAQILSIGSMVMPGGTTDDGKRNNYLSIQLSHYVPNDEDGETLAVRTGYDEVLPHLSSDIFAAAAMDDGVVESIDEKQKVIKVRYSDRPLTTLGNLKLPYLDNILNQYRAENKGFGFLVPESDISKFPMGGVFTLTKSTTGKVTDRLRCESADAIPDKDIARKQSSLVSELVRGKYKALYYIRFIPLGTRTPGAVKSYSYESVHSPISGSYLLQTRVPNVKVGESVKTGDILVYNPGFFVPDPLSKQVTFKHGVTATVAMIEKSSNLEDACEITREFSNRLKMTPCHQREVITKPDAAILSMVKVGDHVETADSLCVISDEYLVSSSLKTDMENLDIMEKLNRQTPSADYTGTISKIRILYGCDREKLSESLKSILKAYEKEVRDNFKALNSDPTAKLPDRPGFVEVGTRYLGLEFTDETVILEFMIEEPLNVVEGDKLVTSLALKSIVSHVSEKPHYTESGIPVDMLFSTTSIMARIVNSPFLGMAERNMSKLKENVLDMYFDE